MSHLFQVLNRSSKVNMEWASADGECRDGLDSRSFRLCDPVLLLAQVNNLYIEALRVDSVDDRLLRINANRATGVIKNGLCFHLLFPSFLG